MSRENFIGDAFGSGFIGQGGIEGVAAVDCYVSAITLGIEKGGAISTKLQDLFPIAFDEENAALGGCVKVGVEKYGVRAWELTITKGEGGKSWRKVALLTFLRLGMIGNTFCSIRPDKLGEHILWWQGLGTSRKNK